MPGFGTQLFSARSTDLNPGSVDDGSGKIIGDERTWRMPPDDPFGAAPGARVLATRWHSLAEGTQEARAEAAGDCHLVKITLRRMNLRLSMDGRTVHDGIAMPGMLHVTEPGAAARCVFRGPYDVLHLHVPRGVIDELASELPGDPAAEAGLGSGPTLDPVAERLGHALLTADDFGASAGRLYADCVSMAIVARLFGRGRGAGTAGSNVSGLVKWRLKRAIDCVEARLAEPVTLAELADAAGLTRMHFAAQFKVATGLRPHEYLLRRRIERAQEALLQTSAPIVDVALSTGFQSQSHFTSVFKRFVGRPPRLWRQMATLQGIGDAARAGRAVDQPVGSVN